MLVDVVQKAGTGSDTQIKLICAYDSQTEKKLRANFDNGT